MKHDLNQTTVAEWLRIVIARLKWNSRSRAQFILGINEFCDTESQHWTQQYHKRPQTDIRWLVKWTPRLWQMENCLREPLELFELLPQIGAKRAKLCNMERKFLFLNTQHSPSITLNIVERKSYTKCESYIERIPSQLSTT